MDVGDGKDEGAGLDLTDPRRLAPDRAKEDAAKGEADALQDLTDPRRMLNLKSRAATTAHAFDDDDDDDDDNDDDDDDDDDDHHDDLIG